LRTPRLRMIRARWAFVTTIRTLLVDPVRMCPGRPHGTRARPDRATDQGSGA
jgi:hypothetical protein